MENELQLFENEEFGKLEIYMIGEKPYFPATECAEILGYSNPRKAILDHCIKDGVTNRYVIDRLGRTQDKKYISEGNLYRLIVRSKLPSSSIFESWIFDTIVPTVRKFGIYATNETLEKALLSPDFAIRVFEALRDEKSKSADLENQVAVLAPKAEYYDMILQSKNALPVSIISKDYGMSAVAFNKLLHDLKIQYKVSETWVLYQEYADKGYTKSKTYKVNEEKSAVHMYWNQSGRLFLYDILKWHGILPLLEQ